MTYGSVTIPKEDFEDRNVKVRVTAFIDADVLKSLKDEALKHGTKYQTLLNQKLRDAVFGRQLDPTLEEAVRELVRSEIRKVG